MKTGIISVVLAVALLRGSTAQVPDSLGSIVPICSRNDPQLDDCIVRSIDQLRPKLKAGIPALEVPALDPLYLDEVVINPNGASFRIVGKGITVKGISDFKIFRFKSDFDRNTFYIGIEFPFVSYQGRYDMNIPTPMMRIKGAGPVNGNATMIRANAVLEGKIVKRGNMSFYQFKTLDLDVKVKDYKVDFRGVFQDKFLDDMAMSLINERSAEFAWMVEPLGERAATSILLNYAERIARHLPIEKVFS